MEDYCKSIVKSFEEAFYDQLGRINAKDKDDDENQGCFVIDNKSDQSTEVPSDCESCEECSENVCSVFSEEYEERNKLACPKCQCLRAQKWAEANFVQGCEIPGTGGDIASGALHLAEENTPEMCPNARRRQKRAEALAADAARKGRKTTFGLPKVGVRQKRVPMTPEQDDSLKDQHKWDTVVPEKRVMKLVGQLLWVARCTRTDVSLSLIHI